MPVVAERAVPEHSVLIRDGDRPLVGNLAVPDDPLGLVILAGAGVVGPGATPQRLRMVAECLRKGQLGTLRLDPGGGHDPAAIGAVHALADDLIAAVDWLCASVERGGAPIGLLGAGACAAAALVAAAERPFDVAAVVASGGRLDDAGSAVARVRAPTLLLVEACDDPLMEPNAASLMLIRGRAHLAIVSPMAEAEVAAQVADHARAWFWEYAVRQRPAARP